MFLKILNKPLYFSELNLQPALGYLPLSNTQRFYLQSLIWSFNLERDGSEVRLNLFLWVVGFKTSWSSRVLIQLEVASSQYQLDGLCKEACNSYSAHAFSPERWVPCLLDKGIVHRVRIQRSSALETLAKRSSSGLRLTASNSTCAFPAIVPERENGARTSPRRT